MHIIKNGDKLTIYSPDQSEVLWTSNVQLTSQHRVFGEHNPDIVNVGGIIMHQTPPEEILADWKKFFSKEYPARLEREDADAISS